MPERLPSKIDFQNENAEPKRPTHFQKAWRGEPGGALDFCHRFARIFNPELC